MFKTLSLDRLLKSILAAFAGAAIILLGLNVNASWHVLAENNRAQQVVAASRQIFTAMINQRTDRSTTQRTWNANEPLSAANRAYLTPLRDAEMPALAASLDLLRNIPFDDKETLLPDLRQSVDKLTALQTEFWRDVAGPKSSRRAALGSEYTATGLAMQDTLDHISANLFASIKANSPFINQMMEVKQLAWLTRQTVGESSLMLSVGLAKGSVAPDATIRFAGLIGGARTLWAAIDDAIIGMPLPSAFFATLTQAKATLFAPDYMARQQRLLAALLTQQTPEMTADQWSPYTVPKLGVMLDVADAALAQAAERAGQDSSAAMRDLVGQAMLLLLALVASAGGFLVVTHRITGPLLTLRDMTQRLARGDLSIVPDFGGRQDEIGAMAAALGTFRQQAIEKAGIEDEQSTLRARAEARRVTVEASISGFETEVGSALAALDQASAQMDHAAADMIQIAQRGASGVRDAEQASGEASNNVSSIAAATEELSVSISEVSRQVAQAARVSLRAVEETQKTDETVRGLVESAARIGEVVSLISDIAAQTNLLALNATIEAARAGEAGKGFAVVASEVKSLANQTAKATEEISGQIAAVRSVTQDAVKAIKQIRGTIDEVNTVAISITSSVEEQGSAMREIARNTQLASERTRDASASVTAVTAETHATTGTAEAVKAAATSLGSEALRLREQVEQFMKRIRAA
ncbi:methyl-accepting chemotaxis protein [Rhodopila sp.]|uniref:methyl-accepting chemotaxis protein n=1 Tax=Rhodopila sp. TaxID=2480087 RepID=UPI003D0F5FAF